MSLVPKNAFVCAFHDEGGTYLGDVAASTITALESELARAREVITDAQDLLATYIVPDSGISEHEVVNQLLGLLDGPKTRAALSAQRKEGEK